jgi:hypothetical protein
MGIVSAAFGATRQVVRMILNDKAIQELMTYRLWTSQRFDEDLRRNVDVYTETENLKTARLKADAYSAQSVAIKLEAGDVLFLMDAAVVPAGASKKDQIVDEAGQIYKIEAIHNVFNIAVVFKVE